MFDLPLHPAVVHVPLGLTVAVPLLAGGLLLAWYRGASPRLWWIAVALQALVALSAVVAVRTGEADEERAEERVPESAIEAHEELATGFAWASAGLLLLFAAGLVPQERAARVLATAGLVGSLATAGLAVGVGHAGGRLVYGPGGSAAIASASGESAEGTGGAAWGGEGSEEDEGEDDDD